MSSEPEMTVKEAPQVDVTMLAAINRAELDQQITTARAYPRSIRNFVNESRDLVSISQEVAEECIYAVPRDGKIIRGPSARFAEVLMSRYRNCRGGARVVAEDENFIVAQGVFHDLETNSATTYEVRRRIVDKRGRRYGPDMIAVTANAACSIALRQAVLKGIPKALWSGVYGAAEQTIAGGNKPLNERRDTALSYFTKLGVDAPRVYARLGIGGYEDLGSDELLTLHGLAQAIREGDLTIEAAFPFAAAAGAEPEPAPAGGVAGLKAKIAPAPASAPPPPPSAAPAASPAAPDAPPADGGPARVLLEDPDGNLVDADTGEIVTRATERAAAAPGKGKGGKGKGHAADAA